MLNAIIYCRVSTPGQAEDGLGLESQLDICHEIAKKYGFNVPEDMEIVEQGSGAYLERELLDKARAIVRSKQASALICSDLDRLSRDEIGTVILLSEARDAGVTILTRTGPVDTTKNGNLITYVSSYAAALERDKIRQRTMDGKRMAAKQGVLPVGTGSGLYGYDYSSRDISNKRKQTRTINSEEATAVRRIFGMALEGLGLSTIARILNADGLRGKKGSLWHPWTIHNLLRNPAYTGLTRYGVEITKLGPGGRVTRTKREDADIILIDGFTPPIIDVTTFERVQRHLERPRRSGHAHEPYMLSGMLRCADCGTGLTGQKMGRRWRYYVCRGTSPTATRPRTCWAKRTRMESLDDRAWSAVSKAVSDPDFIYDRLVSLQSEATPTESDSETLTNKLRINVLAREEKNLVAALKMAPSAAEGIGSELEKIASERKSLERHAKAKEQFKRRQGVVQIDPGAIKSFCQAVRPFLKAMKVEQRKELLSLLGFEATVADSGEVKASISVPSASNPIHHCTNMGMTTWT